MNTHTIPNAWFEAAGLEPDPRLAIAEGDGSDAWRGYLVCPRTWRTAGPLPGLPKPTPREAFDEYVKSRA